MPEPTVPPGGQPTVAELAATIEGTAIRLAEIAGRVAALNAEIGKHSRVLVRIMTAIADDLT
jgi:hypothetical protein